MKAEPIQPQFMTQRQGKDFCLYPGLVDAAHRSGLRGIATTLLQAPAKDNNLTAIVGAVATFVDEAGTVYTFAGIGDANPDNVGRMIAMHAIRMAETRAKARALRDALNISVAAVEELATDDTQSLQPIRPANPRGADLRTGQAPRQLNPHQADAATGEISENAPAPEKWVQRLHKRNAEIIERFGHDEAIPVPVKVTRGDAEQIGALQKKILGVVEVPA